MSNIINEAIDITNNKEETLETLSKQIEAEQSKDRIQSEEFYNQAENLFNTFNLEFTYKSLRYILNKENISLGQLRSCVYINKDTNQAYFDYIQSTLILIKAGLVGASSEQNPDIKKLEDKAYELLDTWRVNFGSVISLHLMIIKCLEDNHFFIQEPDLKVMSHLSYKSLQKDIISNILKEDLEQKMRQVQAYQN